MSLTGMTISGARNWHTDEASITMSNGDIVRVRRVHPASDDVYVVADTEPSFVNAYNRHQRRAQMAMRRRRK